MADGWHIFASSLGGCTQEMCGHWALASSLVFLWVPLWVAVVTVQDPFVVCSFSALFTASAANHTRPVDAATFDGVDVVDRIAVCFAALAALDSSLRNGSTPIFAPFALLTGCAHLVSRYCRKSQRWRGVEVSNVACHLFGSAALLVAIIE